MNAHSYARRSIRRVTDRAALRVLVNAQAMANEIVRTATVEADTLRADARAYVKAITYEAALLHEEAAKLRAEAQFLYPTEGSSSSVTESVDAHSDTVDLDDQFDRYIDLDMGEDPAKDWMLGSTS